MRAFRWLFSTLPRRFNKDPRFQFLFHSGGTIVGLVIMILIPLVYFILPSLWASISILALVLITVYGNLTTDYTGVSDAEAAGHGAALRGIRASALHHRVLGRLIAKATRDAHFQYRLHLALTYTWAVQGLAVVLVFALARPFWNKYSILYTLLVNAYTNFGTDFSALPGTIAAEHLNLFREGRSPWEMEAAQAPPGENQP